jgi:hypothetical protein
MRGEGEMAEKKRIGRPTKPPKPGARVSLGLRVTSEIKEKLDAAARRTGRSQSQEAEIRLERSFEREGLVMSRGDVWASVGIHKGSLWLIYGDDTDEGGRVMVLGINPEDLKRLKDYFRLRSPDDEG